METQDLLDNLESGNGETNETSSKSIFYNFMAQIESKRLNASDSQLIKTSINKFLISNNLSKDEFVLKTIEKRFSIGYLPGISTVPFPSSLNLTRSREPHKSCESLINIAPPIAAATQKTELKQTFHMCTIRRHQSTLWTSYRMYLGGTKELNNQTGEFSNFKEYSPQVMLLGVKKLKSGMSAQCFVWSSEDSKMWKDRLACAKISKTNSIYVGFSVNNNSNSNISNETVYSESSEQPQLCIPAHTHLPHVDSGESDSESDCIVASVNSRATDKLILLSAVIPAPRGSSTADASGGEILPDLAQMEALLRSTSPDERTVSENFLQLKSRLPHKVPSMAGAKKGLHALAFGRDSRVRSASRKNLVVDVVRSASTSVPAKPVGTEWMVTESGLPPVLEVGKVEEDLFAVDFFLLSPLQAFTIAIAAFDQ